MYALWMFCLQVPDHERRKQVIHHENMKTYLAPFNMKDLPGIYNYMDTSSYTDMYIIMIFRRLEACDRHRNLFFT